MGEVDSGEIVYPDGDITDDERPVRIRKGLEGWGFPNPPGVDDRPIHEGDEVRKSSDVFRGIGTPAGDAVQVVPAREMGGDMHEMVSGIRKD